MPFDADLHIHSKYSSDCWTDPKTIIKRAKKRGLSVIAITDHNTVKGGLEARKIAASESNLTVVPGIEVKSDRGDVIGLFIEEEIQSKQFHSVIEEIRRQDGIVVLPHPYKGRTICPEELAQHVDVIEALNGRTLHSRNQKASRLANSLEKPMLASTDAHFSFEVGRICTRFLTNPETLDGLRETIIMADRELVGSELPIIPYISYASLRLKRWLAPSKDKC